MKKITFLFLTLFSVSCIQAVAYETRVIRTDKLELWTDNFGDKSNPAIVLICGSGEQGITWHQEFCQMLADTGYFVIRFDQRDVGLSSVFDYKKDPYTLLDLSKDVILILDDYQIKSAHMVGHSMGGVLSMILAAEFPNRVSTITLFATSLDIRANLDAVLERPTKSKLSPPKKDFLVWVKTYLSNPPKTMDEKIEKFIEGGKLQNGTKFEYDIELNRQIALQSFIRTKSPISMFNHINALDNSYKIYTKASNNIHVPTLIIHGDQDPILPLDHADAMKKAIPQSKLLILQGVGHGLNKGLYPILIENIHLITKKAKKS